MLLILALLIDLYLFFAIKGYLKSSKKIWKPIVWSLFIISVILYIYFYIWLTYGTGWMDNTKFSVYFPGVILSIYLVKFIFIIFHFTETIVRTFIKIFKHKSKNTSGQNINPASETFNCKE